MKNATSRRRFVKQTAAGVGLLSLPALLSAKTTTAEKLKIVCVGGHPDDPESGCGGTLARFTAAGHAVTVIYLTRGEAGIPGKSHGEALISEPERHWKPVKYSHKTCFCRTN